MTVVEIVRDWLSLTCDAPGCDDDPEPLWVDGGLATLCPEHAAVYLAHVVDVEDGEIEHSRECPACGATTYAFERCHECSDCHWKED